MLDIIIPDAKMVVQLSEFFTRIDLPAIKENFDPHPLSAAEAARVCGQSGKDQYFIGTVGGRVVAYSMLRYHGYSVPSIGLCVDPEFARMGIGRCLIYHLLSVLRLTGAESAILKVRRTNAAALRLYHAAGFETSDLDSDFLRGTISLRARDDGAHQRAALGAKC